MELDGTHFGCQPKNRGVKPPQIIHFNRVFHYKPSILGYTYFWKHQFFWCWDPILFRCRCGRVNSCEPTRMGNCWAQPFFTRSPCVISGFNTESWTHRNLLKASGESQTLGTYTRATCYLVISSGFAVEQNCELEMLRRMPACLGVSKNRGGPPKSSILIWVSIINHPFWGKLHLESLERRVLTKKKSCWMKLQGCLADVEKISDAWWMVVLLVLWYCGLVDLRSVCVLAEGE